jgi:hypothetical protein
MKTQSAPPSITAAIRRHRIGSVDSGDNIHTYEISAYEFAAMPGA